MADHDGVEQVITMAWRAQQEDERLKDYLLVMNVTEHRDSGVVPSGELPGWFMGLLEQDSRTRELWSGGGKPAGTDTTPSGFDFSLTQRLLMLGHRDIDDLSTILALRPGGSVQGSRKGDSYIRRTIANALTTGR
jgi:hypothetical protein